MKNLCLFLIVLSSCSCNKEVKYYQFDPSFTDYTIFPIGSYWVYADSTTKVITDSIVLVEQRIQKITSTEGRPYESDRVIQILKRYSGANQGDSAEFSTESYFEENLSNQNGVSVYTLNSSAGGYFPREAFINANRSEHITCPIISKTLQNADVTGNGKKHEVKEFTTCKINNNSTHWFVARGVGLIKLTTDSSTLILINSNMY